MSHWTPTTADVTAATEAQMYHGIEDFEIANSSDANATFVAMGKRLCLMPAQRAKGAQCGELSNRR